MSDHVVKVDSCWFEVRLDDDGTARFVFSLWRGQRAYLCYHIHGHAPPDKITQAAIDAARSKL